MQKFLANSEVSCKAKGTRVILNYMVPSRLAASQSLWQTVTENVNILNTQRRSLVCNSHNRQHTEQNLSLSLG